MPRGRTSLALLTAVALIASMVVVWPAVAASDNLLEGIEPVPYDNTETGIVTPVEGDELCFDVAASDADRWDAGIAFNHFPVVSDASYSVSVELSSDPAGAQPWLNVGLDEEPWPSLGDAEQLTLEAEPTTVALDVTSAFDSDLGQVGFQVGGAEAEYRLCIDDLEVLQLTPGEPGEAPDDDGDPDDTGENLIHNGHFADGNAGWWGLGDATFSDGQACISGWAPDANFGSYSGFSIQEGAEYELSFTASSDPAASGFEVIIQVDGEDDLVDLLEVFEASPADDTYEYTFTGDALGGMTASNNRLVFINESGETVDFCIGDVTLTGGEEDVYEPDTGPRVRVNQLGYLPDGPKRATLVFEEGQAPADGLPWELRDDDGELLADGTTQPQGFDATAGLDTHLIDFSGFSGSGEDLVLEADGETSYRFDISSSLYEQLRWDALGIYYSQRSGIEIDDSIKPGYGRPAGHVAEFGDAAVNEGDLEVPCLPNEGAVDHEGAAQLGGYEHYGPDGWDCPDDYRIDVDGGWYDAGDNGKYVVNSGISVWQLLNLYERNQLAGVADRDALGDGTLKVPEAGNGVPDTLDEVRWNLEWMLSMQVPAGTQMGIDGDTIDAGGLVHHKLHDIAWTGLGIYPHEDPMPRYVHRPSTAATLNLAAAAAQGARLYDSHDAEFASELLAAAEDAWDAARAHPELIAPDTNALDPNPGGGPYNDEQLSDEFYWAAAELWLTTGEEEYLTALQASEHHTSEWDDVVAFDWQEVAAAARLSLALFGEDLPDHEEVVDWVVRGADEYLAIQQEQPFGHPYGPSYVWGSTHQVLNNAVVIAVAYDLTGEERFLDGAIEAIDYVLGRNAINNSYVTAYGTHYSENMHSRWYAHSINPDMPPPPPGKLAGGANEGIEDPVAQAELQGCAPQACYIDDIGSWSTNETTINWNAALAWHASWLDDVGDGQPSWRPVAESPVTDIPAPDDRLPRTGPTTELGGLLLAAVVALAMGGAVLFRRPRPVRPIGGPRHRLGER